MMKQFLSLFRQLIFWMLFFAVQRAIFFSYYYQQLKVEEIRFGEVLSTFYFALKLDLSTTSYILILPFLLLVIQSFGKVNWANILNKIYTVFVLLVYIIISVAELGLYKEWKTKLTYKALVYLQHPGEIVKSVPNWDLVFFFMLFLLQIVIFFLTYQKYFYRPPNYNLKEKITGKILFIILVPGLFM